MELFPPDPNMEPSCPMYKNQLQELVQKQGLLLPIYQNVNEGLDHAPKFRASVLVGKTKYTSKSTFTDQKAAEQDVAKLALESVKNTKFVPELGPLFVHQEPMYSKSILNEYAVKMKLSIPKYQTIPIEGPKTVFISSCEFGSEIYSSGEAESKKVAEQLAAKAAIQSLLVSDLGTLHKVIKSKERLLASIYAKKNSDNGGTSILTVEHPETIPEKQASIQAEIIDDSAGHGAFLNAPESGIKSQPEFKAGWAHDKFPITGNDIQREQVFRAAVPNKFPSTGNRINIQPEFRTGVQSKFPNTRHGIKRQPEFRAGVQNKFPNTGRGMRK